MDIGTEAEGRRSPSAAAADNVESYIDRLVYELETDRDVDDDSEYGNDDVEMEVGEQTSDEEFEYDSDDDTVVSIKPADYERRNSLGSLSEETETSFIWRLDKEESFSDWSIQVTCPAEGGQCKKIYHVHRSALATGLIKSGYFETLFKSDKFRECNENTSEVNLSEDVAACFPDVLDYLYCPPSESQCLVNKDNWYSLKYLADYFIIPKLTEDIEKFLEDDAHNLSHLPEYLRLCCGAGDEPPKRFMMSATRACAEMILSYERDKRSHWDIDPSLLSAIPPAIFLKIMTLLRSSKDIKSLSRKSLWHICIIATKYIKIHQASIDTRYFISFLGELYLSKETSEAAYIVIDLLKIAKANNWEFSHRCSARDMCVDVLSRYFASRGLSIHLIHDIQSKISPVVVTGLICVLSKQQSTTNSERITIKCDIKRGGGGPSHRWVSSGIMKVDVGPTDCVNHLRYLVSRRLDSSVHTIEVYGEDSSSPYSDHHIVSDTCAETNILRVALVGYLGIIETDPDL